MRVVMDVREYGGLPEEQNGCSDPGIICDPQTGELFCFAVWMNGKPGKHQWNGDGSEPGFEIGRSAQFMCVRSRDDGRSWSAPENWTQRLKRPEWWLLAPSPQQGIAVADGTLEMPTQGRDERGVPFTTIMTNRNHGTDWSVGQSAYSEGNEGQTWPESHHWLLDEGRGAGYPSLARVDPEHIGIVYEGSRAHLVFEKIPLAELVKPRDQRVQQSSRDHQNP